VKPVACSKKKKKRGRKNLIEPSATLADLNVPVSALSARAPSTPAELIDAVADLSAEGEPLGAAISPAAVAAQNLSAKADR